MNPFKAVRDFIVERLAPSQKQQRAAAIVDGWHNAPPTHRASYDSAQTSRHNQNHWEAADNRSGNASTTPGVRRTMRQRSRYEAGSNSLYAGVLRSIADHTIGTGPTLQFLSDDKRLNELLEELWKEWTQATAFANKLWLMKETQVRDGECFLLTIGNPALTSRVQLDYQLLEADYVTSLRPAWTPWQVDGITYDPQWNPLSYSIVTQRPNDILPIVWPQQHTVDARFVIHYFRQERPGQGRGTPELQSAFELLAVLRRYIQATVSAAEVAACFAAFIKTNGPAAVDENGNAASADAWLTLEIQRNLITMLPDGYEMQQMDPKQPIGNFAEFVKTLITLLVRCVSMPMNFATCDSSGYNFSSSRLDHQTYFGAIKIDRMSRINVKVLERVLTDFLTEAAYILGRPVKQLRRIAHEWHWPPPVSIDPQKDAAAALANVQNGQASITDIQKTGTIGGDVIAENAAFFHKTEDEIREALFEKIFSATPGAAAKPEEPEPDDKPQPAAPPKAAKAQAAASNRLACASKEIVTHYGRTPAGLKIAAADASKPDAVPGFSMVAYTGVAMRIDGHDHPVVIDLATATINAETPMLYGHDEERPVGHSLKCTIDDEGIRVDQGLFSAANQWRDEVVAGGRRGYPWQASVGGRAEHVDVIGPDETVTVNGRTFTGPVEIAYGTHIREISFLTLGGDENTSAKIAAKAAGKTNTKGAAIMGFEEWVKSIGFDVSALSEEQKQGLMNEWSSKQANAQAAEKTDDEEEEQERAAASDDDTSEEAAEGDEHDENEDEEPTKPKPTTKAGAAKPKTGKRTIQATHHRTPAMSVRKTIRAETAKELRRTGKIMQLAKGNQELAAKALENNWSMDRVELEIMRAARPRGVMAGPLSRPDGSGPDYNAVVECSLLRRLNIQAGNLERLDSRYTPEVINAAEARENRGYSLSRIVHEYLAASGQHSRAGGLDDETIRAAVHQASLDIRAEGGGFSTVSLSGILSNLLNKSLLQAFLAVPTASDKFCGAQDLNDFKVATRYRMSMAGSLVKVGPTGELQDATLGNEQWTNQLDTYGRTITLNRQMMINDDLSAFTDIPRMLGRQAAMSIEEAVFTVLLANANVSASDAHPFFDATHNNYQSGANSALGITGLTNAITLFLKQTDAQGKPIVLNPTTLLVPPELLPLAEQLYKNQNLVTVNFSTGGNPKLAPSENPFINRYRPVMSPYLSNSLIAGGSTTAWYLLADPADVPMISIGYLKGQRTPTIDQGVPDANLLGFRYRCYFDFGIGAVDYRAGVLNAGV